MNETRRGKKWLLLAIKIVVVVAVFWWVRSTLIKAGSQLSRADYDWHLSPLWLFLAGTLYLVGLLPAGLFWHRVLRTLGQDARVLETLRAYYVGHLGKYVPGKTMVVIIRAGMIRSHRVDTVAAGVSVFYETLSMIAVGALLAAGLLAFSFRQEHILFFGSLGMMAVAGLPIVPPVFKRLVRLLGVGKFKGVIPSQLDALGYGTMLAGGVLMTITWIFLGMSLWATLRAIGIQDVGFVEYFASYVCCASLATVAGILSMIPGGFGVRDVMLTDLVVRLFQHLTAADAAVASGLLRIVWLVSELVISGILYFMGPRKAEIVTPPAK
ncbi:MAG: lysylphosphatidylglycerol synthase domain-containing protein [Thermoguttaceae bacterium]